MESLDVILAAPVNKLSLWKSIKDYAKMLIMVRHIGVFKHIIDHSLDGIVVTKSDRRTIRYANSRAASMFGRSVEQIVGINVNDLYIDPAEREELLSKLEMEGKLIYETKFKRYSGDQDFEEVWLSFSLTLMRDWRGRPYGTLGIVRDITENKRVEKEARVLLDSLIIKKHEDLHDFHPPTADHSQRVSVYCEKIAEFRGMSPDKIEEIKWFALLHDIGKMKLNKEELANGATYLAYDEEMDRIRKHTELGEMMMYGWGAPKRILKAIRHHHERCDGKGYPDGLAGDKIPVEARLIAVGDTLDAMTTLRLHRLKMTKELAIEELKRCSGRDFDRQKIFFYNRMALRYVVSKEAEKFACEESDNTFIMMAKDFCSLIDSHTERDLYGAVLHMGQDYRGQLAGQKHEKMIAFLNRVEKNAEKYLVDRMNAELQLDPGIAGDCIEFLKTTKKNPWDLD